MCIQENEANSIEYLHCIRLIWMICCRAAAAAAAAVAADGDGRQEEERDQL